MTCTRAPRSRAACALPSVDEESTTTTSTSSSTRWRLIASRQRTRSDPPLRTGITTEITAASVALRAMLSVIVVNRDGGSLLEPCLRAIEWARGPDSELIVVDNASADGSRDLVRREFPQTHLVELGENTGFSGGVAHGLQVARGEWVALVNND